MEKWSIMSNNCVIILQKLIDLTKVSSNILHTFLDLNIFFAIFRLYMTVFKVHILLHLKICSSKIITLRITHTAVSEITPFVLGEIETLT